MYKCRECGCVFSEPAKCIDWVPYGSTDVALESYYCPSCDSSDYDDEEIVNSEMEEEDDPE